jgi:glycosyltransferase involved in cell wall biosynthesis
MKVLQVGKFYDSYSGGMETVLKNLCEGLKSKVDLHVLVSNSSFGTIHEHSDFPVTRVGSLGTLLSTSISPSFPFWLKKLSGDIINVHVPNPLAELSYLLSRADGNLVVHFHSDIVRQKKLLRFYKPFLDTFYKKAVRIITPTPHHITCSSFLPRLQNKCRIVPYGIFLKEFDLSIGQMRMVDNLRDDRQPKVLFVGRLVYYKGVDILIQAMSNIPAKLWIIGTGPLEPYLKELAVKLDLKKKVEFLGTIPNRDLVSYYHACDLFVLPSIAFSEMFGMVQLEAMACRKPVVATNLPTGVSWVNQDGLTGVLVPPQNVLALAQAMQKLIQNPSLIREMGEAGRKRVEEIFTAEKMTDGVMEVYKEVMNG